MAGKVAPECAAATGQVLFMIGRGGGGHKASAVALRDCLQREGSDWSTHIDLLDVGIIVEGAIHGPAVKFCPSGDDLYNKLMKWGCYTAAGCSGHVATKSISQHRKKIERAFEKLWAERQPAAVVCFVPFLGKLMGASLSRICPDRWLVTVITDMAHSRAHPWIHQAEESGLNHMIVAGNELLESQAKQLGYEKRTLRTSGMVVNPAFYAHDQIVEPPRPVAVLFWGGFPPMRTDKIAKRMLAQFPELDIVVVCGGNKTLHRRLQRLTSDNFTVEGFISAQQLVWHFRRAAFIIGKPGPGGVAEAGVCGTPYVTERRGIMPQEHCVLEFLEETGAGIVLNSLDRLPPDLLASVKSCKDRLTPRSNRAVFEVADYLRQLIAEQRTEIASNE